MRPRRGRTLAGPGGPQGEDTKSLKVFKLGSNVIRFHSGDCCPGLKASVLGSRLVSWLLESLKLSHQNFLFLKIKEVNFRLCRIYRNFFEVLCCILHLFLLLLLFLPQTTREIIKTKQNKASRDILHKISFPFTSHSKYPVLLRKHNSYQFH